MARDEELTPDEAERIVDEHERKHGKDMSEKGPKDRGHDIPSKADRDDPPGWAKHGGKPPKDD